MGSIVVSSSETYAACLGLAVPENHWIFRRRIVDRDEMLYVELILDDQSAKTILMYVKSAIRDLKKLLREFANLPGTYRSI